MTAHPAPNRVTPFGDVVAIAQRGAWLGNRGRIHDLGPDGEPRIARFHASNLWIVCALQFRDRKVEQWGRTHYTVLFFLDEAVAFAAGHRPCAECRRPAYRSYLSTAGLAGMGAPELNRRLHAERLLAGTHTRRLHVRGWADLPVGAFVVVEDIPMLVLENVLRPWSRSGYGPRVARPLSGAATVLTPPTSLAALAGGYGVQIAAG